MRVGEYAKFAFAIFTPSGSHTQVYCPVGPLVLFRARYVRSAATEPPSQHSRAAVVPCGYRAPAVAHSSMASLALESCGEFGLGGVSERRFDEGSGEQVDFIRFALAHFFASASS